MFCLLTVNGGSAQEQGTQADQPQVFTVPKAYPVERYEAGWNKNPFTLKTAPTVVDQDSFAKDLAIGSYFGDAKDPTVVVVNTKTGKRTSLKKSQPEGKDGMKLKELKFADSRKDVVAEVTMGSQTAEVKFNSDYLKQVAGADAARGGQQGNAPGQMPPGARPGQQPSGAPGQVMPAGGAPRPTMPPMPQQAQNRGPVPQGGGGGPGVLPNNTAVAAANRTINTAAPASALVNPVSTPVNASTASSDAPVVNRRRVISAVDASGGTQ